MALDEESQTSPSGRAVIVTGSTLGIVPVVGFLLPDTSQFLPSKTLMLDGGGIMRA